MIKRWSLIAATAFWFVGCSVVGTGHRTVVRAQCGASVADDGTCAFIATRYPNLIAKAATEPVLVIDGNGSPLDISAQERRRVADSFRAYLERKYGSPDFQGARLDANFYDRNQSPPFLAYDTSAVYPALLATVLPTKKFTLDEIIGMRNTIEAQVRNVPEQPQVTVRHDRVVGEARYFYYPRVALDFSVQFPSTSPTTASATSRSSSHSSRAAPPMLLGNASISRTSRPRARSSSTSLAAPSVRRRRPRSRHRRPWPTRSPTPSARARRR